VARDLSVGVWFEPWAEELFGAWLVVA